MVIGGWSRDLTQPRCTSTLLYKSPFMVAFGD